MKKIKKFYKYNAVITRVVDGDTVDARVELGFNVSMDIRFRLLGFDAPESYRPKDSMERIAGNNATAALMMLVEGKEVIIESNKFGKYRWLGTIYLPDEPELSINQVMIDMGHVK